VQPPSSAWAYRWAANHSFKGRRPTTTVDDMRHAAATSGNIRDWFSRMTAQLNPAA
jgi:hypothetical protein